MTGHPVSEAGLAVLSATATARLVSTGRLPAVTPVGAALDRAKALDGELLSFTALWPEQALEAARRVADRLTAGERLPLAGVPIGLKGPGSREAFQVRQLEAAGAVPIGVTATPTTTTPWQTWGYTDRGPTVNPWRADRSPGGSSAGSAAAVAAGIVPLATAVDGAGSTRIPAAWCGVVGLKPTNGLIPTADPTGLAVGGPITRTVADAAAYLDAVAGTSLLRAVPETRPPLSAAWSADLGFAEVDPDVAAVARKAMTGLVSAGLLTPVNEPVILHDPQPVWLALRAAGTADTRAGVELNRVELDRLFRCVDVLVTPTTPNRPHSHEGPGTTMSTALTWAFNLSGHPAVTVPAGFTPDGCPVGAQFVTRRGEEATLIRLSAAWERIAPWPGPGGATKPVL